MIQVARVAQLLRSFGSPGPLWSPRLEVLDLSGNDEIDMDDLGPLAESEYLSPQTELDVSRIGGVNRVVVRMLRERLGRRLSE